MIPANWVLLRFGWSFPLIPPWATASRFLAGNRDAELKSTPFSSLLLLQVFLSFLSRNNPPRDIEAMIVACWGYSLIIIIHELSSDYLNQFHEANHHSILFRKFIRGK